VENTSGTTPPALTDDVAAIVACAVAAPVVLVLTEAVLADPLTLAPVATATGVLLAAEEVVSTAALPPQAARRPDVATARPVPQALTNCRRDSAEALKLDIAVNSMQDPPVSGRPDP
jgi:hypothetical protein